MTADAARLADKLLRPARVAIVGASGDLKKNNSRPQRYLRKHGYTGEIYPINPGYKELFGEPCYAALKDTPHPADHAYVMVPPAAIEGVIRECGEAGVACATIFSGGFAEGGAEGRHKQEELVRLARSMGVRLLGPNSLGVINTGIGLTLSANAVLERETLPKGRTALVSQSGGMLGALVSRGQARDFGFSALVSVGNECDLSVGEIAGMLVDDPGTDVILLFLETLREPGAMRAMAEKAQAAGKPVLAYTLGRSELGQKLAQSHTGAMVGQAKALDAFLAANGIMRLALFESLIEAPALVRGRRPATGRTVAIATTTGGAAALVADHLGSAGISVAPAHPDLRATLAKSRIEVGEDAPIIDLTMAGTKPEIVDAVMASFMDDPRVDAVIMGVGSSSEYYPELAVAPLVKWAKSKKPLVAFLLPNAPKSLALLAEAGIPAFRTPEACADALSAYLSWRPMTARKVEMLPEEAAQILSAAGPGSHLNEQNALSLFAALGVPTPRMAVLEKPEDSREIDLTFPVVAKILSADIAHKSDVGGVKVGLADNAALEDAARSLLTEVPERAKGARIDGVIVQEMEKGRGEAIVGFRHDGQVGPVVAVGVGGVLAEVYGDVAVRPAPVDLATAREMVAEVKGFAPLRGFRGLPKGDLDALAQLVASVSLLALAAGVAVQEAEINPVIVRDEGTGVVAVDGLVMLGAATGRTT